MADVLNICNKKLRSRDSSVGIATGYGVGRPKGRSSSRGRGKIFFPLNFIWTSSGAHQTSYIIGTGGGSLSPEIKWPRREAEYSPTSAEVNTKNYTPTWPLIC
jgi:hypothetical protein